MSVIVGVLAAAGRMPGTNSLTATRNQSAGSNGPRICADYSYEMPQRNRQQDPAGAFRAELR